VIYNTFGDFRLFTHAEIFANICWEVENKMTAKKNCFSRILVAVDYLDLTSEIFKKACVLAQKHNSKLMIFHCVAKNLPGVQDLATMSSIYTFGGVYSSDMLALQEEITKETAEQLTKWLNSFCKEANNLGIEAECDYILGDPGKQICQKAKEWEADLIIVGRRGRSGLTEVLLGSVSNYVLHHAHCSILVVQH
jgi:nucleotide-binding universal stress UspA family protein